LFSVDLQSRKPIFEQIYDNLRDEIISGVISQDAKLPSVRETSERLSVSPNTVMKAFRALEDRGYVYSSPGLGTFAAAREAWREGDRMFSNALELLRRAALELSHCGKTVEEVLELTKAVYMEVCRT